MTQFRVSHGQTLHSTLALCFVFSYKERTRSATKSESHGYAWSHPHSLWWVMWPTLIAQHRSLPWP